MRLRQCYKGLYFNIILTYWFYLTLFKTLSLFFILINLKLYIMSTFEIEQFLKDNDCNWLTVLIDHTYNTIDIYGVCVGLDASNHLGEDYNDWLTDDLYTYIEVEGAQILEFKDTHKINIVNQ